MKLIIIILLLCVNVNAASLKLISKGKTAGLPSGLYFELTNMEPFIMYKLEYSEDLIKWKEMVRVGTYSTHMKSPFWAWDELPPQKCFFRLVLAQ
tara:strand:+ start:237 stop:521 length:285 start_codon:yes stop_codon:yes gene_type:complete